MTHKFAFLLVATSLCYSTKVFAQEPYLGISIATPGEGSWQYAPGSFVADNKHNLSKKLYGGVECHEPIQPRNWLFKLGLSLPKSRKKHYTCRFRRQDVVRRWQNKYAARRCI